jgi:Uma2 family endonuclease
MPLAPNKLEFEIVYPDADGAPMAESDPARDYLIYGVEALSLYFQERNDVYVSGNLFIYYKKGVPDAVISPDVFVVFGVEKKKRRSYKVWEEGGNVPGFVLEITSKTTQEEDEAEKPFKYERMGVLEYFQYDPTGDYMSPPLKGSRLLNEQYEPMPLEQSNDDRTLSLFSQVLELELRVIDGELRFYTPSTGQKLLSHLETEQARQQAEKAQRQAEQALQAEMANRRAAITRLLALGLSVDQVADALSLSVNEVREANIN